ncbi:MAG TPA: hypothetical protein VGH65_08800 [Verrucomicrobiaceae bacterium]|jgi:hypothetical protein
MSGRSAEAGAEAGAEAELMEKKNAESRLPFQGQADIPAKGPMARNPFVLEK